PLAAPGPAPEAAKPRRADMRLLAVGFEELSAKAAAPPPPQPVPASTPVAVVQAAPPPPVVASAPRIYTAEDRTVVPPGIIHQALPSFRGVAPVERVARLAVVIDELGNVESAVMVQSVNSTYDKAAVARARTWRYSPAHINGVPVKFRKLVQITVKPTS